MIYWHIIWAKKRTPKHSPNISIKPPPLPERNESMKSIKNDVMNFQNVGKEPTIMEDTSSEIINENSQNVNKIDENIGRQDTRHIASNKDDKIDSSIPRITVENHQETTNDKNVNSQMKLNENETKPRKTPPATPTRIRKSNKANDDKIITHGENINLENKENEIKAGFHLSVANHQQVPMDINSDNEMMICDENINLDNKECENKSVPAKSPPATPIRRKKMNKNKDIKDPDNNHTKMESNQNQNGNDEQIIENR